MSFQKATKKKAKLRLALFGTAGSGKTYTALRIATGIGGKIAVIDSERGSASKYSDRFEFDVCEIDVKKIDEYAKCIHEASKAGYSVLIIDSLSHAWQDLLEEVERVAQAKFRGNTWSAWSEGTPKQRALVDAILSFGGHVIATMRSKTEWTITQDSNGRNKPTRVGLAPEQGKGIEYEFDILMELTPEHVGNILKDRTGKFQDSIIQKPDESFGKSVAEWLSGGAEIKFDDSEKRKRALDAIAKATDKKMLDSISELASKYFDSGDIYEKTFREIGEQVNEKHKSLTEKG